MIPICQTAVCILIALSGALEQATGPNAMPGYLSAYAELPTTATVAYRQEAGDIPYDLSSYDVLIAVADCMLIGREGMLYTAYGAFSVIVMDCAGNDGTPSWMAENNIVAEVDWYTWQAYPEIVGSAAVLVME